MKRLERMTAALEAELSEVDREIGNHRPGAAPPEVLERAAILRRIMGAARGRKYQRGGENVILRTIYYEGMVILWRMGDQRASLAEGWCLDVVHGGHVAMPPRLQEDAANVPTFQTVAHAVTWVLDRAREGSDRHIRAMVFEGAAIFHAWGDVFVRDKHKSGEAT